MNDTQLYRAMLDNINVGIYFVDTNRRIVFWNEGAQDITGYAKEEIVGMHCQDNILNHIDREGRPLCMTGCPLFASIIDQKKCEDEVYLRHKKGHRVAVRVSVFPIMEGEEIVGAMEVFAPDTQQTYDDNLITSLTDSAMQDVLTHIPNRRYLDSFLEYKLTTFHRFGEKVCIVFLDIDNFRNFNNECGHDMGDEVLRNVGAKLNSTKRKSDLVGRWGGEEFVGVFAIKNDYEASIIGEKIRAEIESIQLIKDGECKSVTASVGVTIVRHGDTSGTVIERADKLMFEAKNRGKNCVGSDA